MRERIGTVIRSMLALLSACAVGAPQRRITGRVTAEEVSTPIAAAMVTVVGSTASTYTGDDGRFSIATPSGGSAALRVRRPGFRQRVANRDPFQP